MDKRTILAFALSFAVLVGWSLFFGPKPDSTRENDKTSPPAEETPAHVTKAPAVSTPAPTPAKKEAVKETPPVNVPQAGEQLIEVETPLYKATLSNVGPTFKSFKLKKYRETTNPDAPLIELVRQNAPDRPFLGINFYPEAHGSNPIKTFRVDEDRMVLSPESPPRELVFTTTTEDGISSQHTYRFYPDHYRIDLHVDVANRTENPLKGIFNAWVNAKLPADKGGYYAYAGLAALLNNELEEVELEDPGEVKQLSGKVGWLAYEDSYFILAIVPDIPTDALIKGRMVESGLVEGRYLPPATDINPGEQASVKYELYLGPRDLGVMKDFGRGLDKAINFGWTDIIAKPLLVVLRFFDRYIHNYGVSIILLTILVKILFWPLTHKSYKSMKEMQKLQPMMAKIREKYKNDKQKLNQEMMGLYKTYKVNPMGGCLPMVIQIPVFFALFRVLGNCIELRHAPFMLWINDLSAPDRLFHFPFSIPFMTPPYGIPVLTLLMGASMFLQQKMTPTPGDPTQAKIMMFLPIIFTFMFINFPSGLVLYWLVNNLLSIGQQYRIHKK
ncbi:MAG: membrane protein insertase YidC [Deltaproteobacteria bacterium]|nr:membrane protein insertase YidC [Deltaproteobacteria bacterium]